MKSPYIIISTAMSADGKIATSSRKPIKLSNKEDLKAVDKLRSECDAILVGSRTIKKDNPRLILKNEKLKLKRVQKGFSENPAKVAISKYCDIPTKSNFLQEGDSTKYVFTTNLASKKDLRRVRKYANVIVSNKRLVNLITLVNTLYKKGIRKLLVEGGGTTNFEFMKNGLVDKLRIAVAPRIIGGSEAPTLADGTGFNEESMLKLKLLTVKKLKDIVVLWYKKEYGFKMNDDFYMKIALQEAKKCKPSNKAYSTGAVIVNNGKILGTCYSRKYRRMHAEECVLKYSKSYLEGSVLYTTIEPCSTRLSGEIPCIKHILNKKISRVVFAAYEPKIFVNGKGAQILAKKGVKVSHLKKFEEESLALNSHLLK